jgi:5-methylcytosine-specific restriction enzyme A
VTQKRPRRELPLARNRSGKLRRQTLERDNYVCQKCEQPYPETNLHADHIIPLSQGGEDRVVNMQTLCIPCHALKTKEERNEQKSDRS